MCGSRSRENGARPIPVGELVDPAADILAKSEVRGSSLESRVRTYTPTGRLPLKQLAPDHTQGRCLLLAFCFNLVFA